MIEFDPVDSIAAGALGEPGARTFVIQARKGDAVLSVLVEKEQVALLAVEAEQFLDRLDAGALEAGDLEAGAPEAGDPEAGDLEEPGALGGDDSGGVEEHEPLFRARLIGIGYDPERHLVLIELREQAVEEGEAPPPTDEGEGHVARLYATRAQVRAMVAEGAAAVAAGRPRCQLCGFPIDPGGHVCPRLN